MEAPAHCEEGRHRSETSLELQQRLDPSELSMEELCLETREGLWMSSSTVFSSFSQSSDWSTQYDPESEDGPRSVDQRLDSDEDLEEDNTGDTYSDQQSSDHSVVSDKLSNALNEPRRGASPVPSYLSVRTDQSREPPLKFTESHHSVKQRIKKRRVSPVSSCDSLRSNRYTSPPQFFQHDLSIDQMVPKKRLCSESGEKSKHQHNVTKRCFSQKKSKEKTRREASFSSCVSLKSNQSKDPPLSFKDGQHSLHPTSRGNEKRKRTLRNEKRRVSLVSRVCVKRHKLSRGSEDVSEHWELDNKMKRHSSHKKIVRQKETRGEASFSSFLSLKSNQSKHQPLTFKDGRHSLHPTSRGNEKRELSLITDQVDAKDFPDQSALVDHQHLDVVFKLLEKNVVTFVRNQLKVFHRTLTQSADWVGELGNDEKVINEKASEASLKIAVQFLKEMKHEQLADDLQRRLVGHICHRKVRSNLKKKFQCLFEGIAKAGNPTFLNQIYTELFVTEGGTSGVNNEHEVRQIEKVSRSTERPEITVRCQDLFNHTPERDQPVRMMLTKGVAGIGKTILTQKFTLDWAEGKTYHDIQFTFPFTFRELNLIKDKRFSLVELVHHFFPETKEAGLCSFKDFQVVFIFDGLDECRLPLDFHNNKILTDVTESTSVDMLLTNLIKGNLLPSARLWITTRPAAANQIPPECVDMVTEVRGFTDKQKEEYFRKRFRDEKQASSIIYHIKSSQSLHIMCHIPVFCWITATVLEDVLKTREGGDLPKTLTEMYIHFLVVQSKVKNVKYDGGAGTDPNWSPQSRKMIESLGKLAFEQLQKGNLIFYESDLTECGIDIRAASVYSGVFTQIFKEERGLYQDKVFCFVHLSVQEFLAALYVHLMFINSGVNLLESNTAPVKSDLHCLHQSAVNKALQSPNGHLDLFLRFLLGLSLQSNHILLRGLMTGAGGEPQGNQETVEFIKKKTGQNPSSERNINLFYCLNELNDHSLEKEIQQYLHSGNLISQELSPAQWSALVFILLSSRQDLDVFDLKRYCCSELGLLRMLPVVKASKKAVLSSCNLSVRACNMLASVLTCTSSSLIELDLSYNKPQDSGVKKLSVALECSDCRLETLRLCGCELASGSYQALASALSSQSSSLKKLDLSGNHLCCSDVKLLCDGLRSPCCKLEILGLRQTSFSKTCAKMLSLVLNLHPSSLRELDLSDNDLKDSGVKLLSAGLESPHCKLKTLRLSGCLITERGCYYLDFALKANPLHMRRLDLRYNHPGDSGRMLFSAKHKNPQSRLKKLWFRPCGEQWLKPGLNKYTRGLTLDLNTAHKNLRLSEDCRTVTLVQEDQLYSDNPDRFDCCQLLCEQGLTGRCYWEVEWKGLADIAVTYKGIRRRGNSADCRFGGNDKSWSLYCSDGGYSVWHNNRETVIHPPSSSAFTRVAVYLDWDAGTLSFYGFCSRKWILLHTFSCKFTEPLIPGFGVGSSVCLCEPEFFRKTQ